MSVPGLWLALLPGWGSSVPIGCRLGGGYRSTRIKKVYPIKFFGGDLDNPTRQAPYT
jgi:hypothetical protein